MDICGYIYLADADTNRQDLMRICVYKCSNISSIADDTPCAEYVIDKNTMEFLSVDNDFTYVSYLMVSEIASTAIRLDKSLDYPAIASFSIDIQGNPQLRVVNTYKDIFPVPRRTDIYMKPKVYFNITDIFFTSDYVTPLEASVACEYLNFIALRDGLVSDWMFSPSCGRIFINTACHTSSFSGRRWLKRTFPEQYNYLKGKVDFIPDSFAVKRHKTSVNLPVISDDFVNQFLRIHTESMRELSESVVSVADVFDAPQLISDLCSAEIAGYREHLPNLLWQGIVKTPKDFDCISVDDLLSLILPHGRDMLGYHVVNNRKFYNYHKGRSVSALFSNGIIKAECHQYST